MFKLLVVFWRYLFSFVPGYSVHDFAFVFCGCVFWLLQGWWESLDFLDEDKMADKRMREEAIEAAKMKDPSLIKEGEEPEMDDIFTDFLKEEKSKVPFSFLIFEWLDELEVEDEHGPSFFVSGGRMNSKSKTNMDCNGLGVETWVYIGHEHVDRHETLMA